jgi:hypothetical protein
MGGNVLQQCLGFGCQVSANEFNPLDRNHSRCELSFTGGVFQLQPNQRSGIGIY